MAHGSLVVIGTGIKLAAHITVEARAWIEEADRVFFLMNGSIVDDWIYTLNPQAENLARFYANNKRRLDTYLEMVEHILTAVRQGNRVCAAFYGHPGVFVFPAHEAIRQAHQEGFSATMLPGISAEDCLFADLGFDPSYHGCQSYEATDFLVRPRHFDTSTGLILWQIGAVGQLTALNKGEPVRGLPVLVEYLSQHYPANHMVIIYEAALTPIDEPSIQRVELQSVMDAVVSPISTMYIPPITAAAIDPNMLQRLGLSLETIRWDKR